jgi:hypothetical protein
VKREVVLHRALLTRLLGVQNGNTVTSQS